MIYFAKYEQTFDRQTVENVFQTLLLCSSIPALAFKFKLTHPRIRRIYKVFLVKCYLFFKFFGCLLQVKYYSCCKEPYPAVNFK